MVVQGKHKKTLSLFSLKSIRANFYFHLFSSSGPGPQPPRPGQPSQPVADWVQNLQPGASIMNHPNANQPPQQPPQVNQGGPDVNVNPQQAHNNNSNPNPQGVHFPNGVNGNNAAAAAQFRQMQQMMLNRQMNQSSPQPVGPQGPHQGSPPAPHGRMPKPYTCLGWHVHVLVQAQHAAGLAWATRAVGQHLGRTPYSGMGIHRSGLQTTPSIHLRVPTSTGLLHIWTLLQ